MCLCQIVSQDCTAENEVVITGRRLIEIAADSGGYRIMNQNHSSDIPDAIVNSLSSLEEETRRLAVVALSSVPLEKSSGLLFRAMGDTSWRVRKEAVEVYLSSKDAEHCIGALFNLLRSQDNAGLRNSAAEALARLGKSSLPVLALHAQDSDSDVRKFVIDILGATKDPSSVQVLVRALADSDPNVATAAAENLGNIGCVEALQPLLSALSRQDITFRHAVLGALAKIGQPLPSRGGYSFSLGRCCSKKQCMSVSGSVGSAEAVPIVVRGLAEAGKSVRVAAVKALMAIRDRVPEEWADKSLRRTLCRTGTVSGCRGAAGSAGFSRYRSAPSCYQNLRLDRRPANCQGHSSIVPE